MQAKRVRYVRVLPKEFSIIHLHGFLPALSQPRPDSQLPRLIKCCLDLVKTASPTSLTIV